MSDAEIGHFMGRAKELQVDVLGVIGVPANLDPAAPDASIRKAGIDYEMNLIRTCAKGRHSLRLRRPLEWMALAPGYAWRHQS